MILGILQARMNSSRLPGKVLKEVLGKPMLIRQVERIKRSKFIDDLIIATSINPLDNKIEDFCIKNKLKFFRGDEEDLLDRFYKAAKKHNARIIVRLTGDDPLTDPDLIDDMIKAFENGNYHAVSNSNYPTYPEGLDLTVFSFETLKDCWKNAKLKSQREHVIPYMFENKDKYKVYHYKQDQDKSHLRWTVDYEEDLLLIREIYRILYHQKNNFSSKDIYKLLENQPTLVDINSKFIRNEGLIKSLENDELIK